MDSKAMNREAAESAAAQWIARRECDGWSEEDNCALQTWIAADMHHRTAWLRLNAAWERTARLRALKTTVAAGVVPAPGEVHLPFFAPASKSVGASHDERPRGRFRRLSYVMAASLAAAAVLVGVMYLQSTGSTYRTDVGAVQTIALADGSRVTLNTRTQIRVGLTNEDRRVRLDQGEAYFEVAKDPSRPFIVEAGERRIVAVGTQFSVRREAGDVRVLVTEGAVRMDTRDAAAAPGAHNSPLLTVGAVARAQKQDVLVQQKDLAEVEQALTWRTGYLTFDRTPLAEAVAEFNRYNERQVRIEDPALGAIPVGGSFRAANVDAFLRLVERELPLRAVEKDRQVVLKGARRSP